MSKTLILLRHGKSDWSKGTEDFDRPLNGRGRRSAALMGAWLADEGFLPEVALVSAAARTRETFARLTPLLPDSPKVAFRRDLYLAEAGRILSAVQSIGSGKTALYVGHNPGIEDCASELCPGGRDLTMPTCAVAVFCFDCDDWAGVAFGAGDLIAFEVPKGLV